MIFLHYNASFSKKLDQICKNKKSKNFLEFFKNQINTTCGYFATLSKMCGFLTTPVAFLPHLWHFNRT
jgi:hypothetical protein